MKVGVSNHQPVCECHANNFCTDRCIFRTPLKITSMPHFFNLIASATPKLRTFKLLRWVQRNPLINFESIGRFGLNLVWKWWQWRWPRLHTVQCRSLNYSNMADVQTSEVGATFEPIGGFEWNFVWRWWHWMLLTVSLCRESRHISSSQNFLLVILVCFRFFVIQSSVLCCSHEFH
jgi:hypothetical protein